MAVVLNRHGAANMKRGGRPSLEFRAIFTVVFVFFVLAAVVERLLPWKWLAHRSEGRSIFEQAWEAAGTCTTYAFMG